MRVFQSLNLLDLLFSLLFSSPSQSALHSFAQHCIFFCNKLFIPLLHFSLNLSNVPNWNDFLEHQTVWKPSQTGSKISSTWKNSESGKIKQWSHKWRNIFLKGESKFTNIQSDRNKFVNHQIQWVHASISSIPISTPKFTKVYQSVFCSILSIALLYFFCLFSSF